MLGRQCLHLHFMPGMGSVQRLPSCPQRQCQSRGLPGDAKGSAGMLSAALAQGPAVLASVPAQQAGEAGASENRDGQRNRQAVVCGCWPGTLLAAGA